MNTIYESLRELVDLVKLNAYKDGLEVDLNTLQATHENVTDLLMRLELPGRERETWQVPQREKCLAEIKVKIKDQEMERVELISWQSLPSRRSVLSIQSSSTTSSKRAAIETAKIKVKLDTLKRRQEIESRRDELKFQEKELQHLDEQEELHGELSTAKAIQKILQESELNDTIVLPEVTEKSTKQTEKERISDSETVGRLQAQKAARKEIKEKDNQVNDPIVVRTLK